MATWPPQPAFPSSIPAVPTLTGTWRSRQMLKCFFCEGLRRRRGTRISPMNSLWLSLSSSHTEILMGNCRVRGPGYLCPLQCRRRVPQTSSSSALIHLICKMGGCLSLHPTQPQEDLQHPRDCAHLGPQVQAVRARRASRSLDPHLEQGHVSPAIKGLPFYPATLCLNCHNQLAWSSCGTSGVEIPATVY